MDASWKAQFDRRLRELYRERIESHVHRLDEWRRQQAATVTHDTELADTVC